MKGSLLWRLMYLFCALTGCLAGFGIFYLTGAGESKPNTTTKDNTLVRESQDGVFFDGINELTVQPTVPVEPTAVPDVGQAPETAVTGEDNDGKAGEAEPVPSVLPAITVVPEEQEVSRVTEEASEITPAPQTPTPAGALPSMGSQWVDAEQTLVPTIVPTPIPAPAEETITYPYEIFGQVPVVNRSDAYVTYFEFAIDLIEALEPEIQQRGLSMNSLLMKFVVKALFCGVDVEDLNINATIPRRQAALCLWLAAQILEEDGTGTSAKSVQAYVTDISKCSNPEKKAMAYLYEQGIVSGYQVAGQQFYPDAGLSTEAGNVWLLRTKQCWQ